MNTSVSNEMSVCTHYRHYTLQTDRQEERQTDRRTDRWTDRQEVNSSFTVDNCGFKVLRSSALKYVFLIITMVSIFQTFLMK